MLGHTVMNIRENFGDAVVALLWCSGILVQDPVILVYEVILCDQSSQFFTFLQVFVSPFYGSPG